MKMKLATIGAACGCLFLSLGVLSAADKKAEAKPKAPAAAAGLPSGAVQTAAGTYSYTDPEGKKWIYRQTPFGLARIEDHEAASNAAAAELEKKQADQTHAFEDGDSIRFERPGPFGVYRWTQKKTELNSLEQTVWNRDRESARQAAAREKE
jgi:hypothetical protein